MQNILIYKAVFDSYDDIDDSIIELQSENINITYKYLSNRKNENKEGWDCILKEKIENDSALTNRYYKMCYWDDFEKYDYSIYLDGNIKIVSSLERLIESLERKIDIYAVRHPYRNDQKSELDACLLLNKIGLTEYFLESFNLYREKRHDLFECGILIKNHKSVKIKLGMQTWFDYYKISLCRRDQIFFTKSMIENNLSIGLLQGINIREEKTQYFKLLKHKRNKKKVNKIKRGLLRLIVQLKRCLTFELFNCKY